jgi:hypothetical protein
MNSTLRVGARKEWEVGIRVQDAAIDITRELAMTLMIRNTENRPLRRRLVEKLSRQIRDGRYYLNGEPIIIATDGTVLNGQHTLTAVIETGVAVRKVVIYGVDKVAKMSIDTGAVKTVGDHLNMDGEPYGKTLASVLGWLWRFENSNGSIVHRTHAIGPPEAFAERSRHPGVGAYVQRVSADKKLRSLLAPSLLAVCWYQFSRIDSELADCFFDLLKTGTGLLETDPVYHLREQLRGERDSRMKKPPEVWIALVRKAWNFTREGRKIKALSWRSNSEPFPEI